MSIDRHAWRRPSRDMLLGLPCLTLWIPWGTYIVHPDMENPKGIENRTWHPPRRLVGGLLGIHAGGTVDHDVESWPRCRLTPKIIKHGRIRFALIGVARLAGSTETCPTGQDRWWVGPVGWRLENPVCFDEPIPMKGSQGVWTIDEARLDGTPPPDKPPPEPDPQLTLL